MKKYLIFCFIVQSMYSISQTYSCNMSTVTPNGIFFAGPAYSFTATFGPTINYLCPNAIVYDTTSFGDRWIVMIEPGANYIWDMCGPALSHIFVKAGGTLTINKINCPTAKQVYLEPGSIIVDPFNAMSANTVTYSCSSLIFPTVNCAASVNELEKNTFGFSFYPNPTSNSIYLNLESINSNTISIKIQNQFGEIISDHPNWNTLKKEISVSDLSNGVYFISVQSGKFIRAKKLVVLK